MEDEHNRASRSTGARYRERVTQHTVQRPCEVTEREKETDDDDGPANSLAVMQEAATRQNKLATEKQIALMSGSTRRMPVYQGVGPCLGTLRDPNSPTNSPDGAGTKLCHRGFRNLDH